MEEVWKPIDIQPYEVSNLGSTRNARRFTLLRKTLTDNGYERVTLRSGKKYVSREIHRLVAQAFIPNEEEKKTVNHKNKIRNDNRVENLEWATTREQAIHQRNTENDTKYMPATTITYEPHDDEIWKDVVGTNLYEVSNYGFVRNKRNNYIKTLSVDGRGYVTVSLHAKPRSVHRVVAEAYIANFTKDCIVNHKDCNKSNNHVSNLECTTQRLNILHAYAHNCHTLKKKTKCISVDMNGVIQGSYESLASAEAETGINRGRIHHALSHGNCTGGLKWYHTYEDFERDRNNIASSVFTIFQCDMKGNTLATFHSYPQAQEKTGINKANISRAINRNKNVLGTAGGYIWYSNRVDVQHLLNKLKNEK